VAESSHRRLTVSDTKVTDSGLVHLKGLTKLLELDLRKTKVTTAGVADLQKAIPNCKIEWDGAK
jgi:internalin A